MSDKPFQLIPSFLSMDIDGRVMRVDRSVYLPHHTAVPLISSLSNSFSKIMAPGMRLGWITSNPLFHECLVHLTDSSTHHPHAFGQIFITEMLSSPTGWRISGFDKWVRSLRLEYQRRRDVFMRAFLRDVASTGFASAEFPEAGMFVWIKVDVERHPRFRRSIQSVQGAAAAQVVQEDAENDLCAPSMVARTNVAQLMEELFERCLDGGLVVMPASIFVTPAGDKVRDVQDPVEDVSLHSMFCCDRNECS